MCVIPLNHPVSIVSVAQIQQPRDCNTKRLHFHRDACSASLPSTYYTECMAEINVSKVLPASLRLEPYIHQCIQNKVGVSRIRLASPHLILYMPYCIQNKICIVICKGRVSHARVSSYTSVPAGRRLALPYTPCLIWPRLSPSPVLVTLPRTVGITFPTSPYTEICAGL